MLCCLSQMKYLDKNPSWRVKPWFKWYLKATVVLLAVATFQIIIYKTSSIELCSIFIELWSAFSLVTVILSRPLWSQNSKIHFLSISDHKCPLLKNVSITLSIPTQEKGRLILGSDKLQFSIKFNWLKNKI